MLFLQAALLAGLAVMPSWSRSEASAPGDDVANTVPTRRNDRLISDSWLTAKVRSEIHKSHVANGVDIEVTSRRGVVTLRGTLASADDIGRVKALVADINGVSRVDASSLVVAAK